MSFTTQKNKTETYNPFASVFNIILSLKRKKFTFKIHKHQRHLLSSLKKCTALSSNLCYSLFSSSCLKTTSVLLF